jgi:hypothetical protein
MFNLCLTFLRLGPLLSRTRSDKLKSFQVHLYRIPSTFTNTNARLRRVFPTSTTHHHHTLVGLPPIHLNFIGKVFQRARFGFRSNLPIPSTFKNTNRRAVSTVFFTINQPQLLYPTFDEQLPLTLSFIKMPLISLSKITCRHL